MMQWFQDHVIEVLSGILGALFAWFTLKAKVDRLQDEIKLLREETRIGRERYHEIINMIATDRAEIYFLKQSRKEEREDAK